MLQPNEEEFAVYSFDPGTVNFSVSKIAITVDLSNRKKYYGVRLVWNEILQVRYNGTKKNENKRTDEDMTRALCDEFMTGKVSKICKEFEAELSKRRNKKLFLLVEPQLDQILGGGAKSKKGAKGEKGSKGKKGFFKDPMLFVFYHAVHVFFYSRYGKSVQFVSWRGHDKSGLSDIHGDDRKEETIPVACKFLREEGFEESAKFIESLKRPKPAQDVADTYNQGRNFILNFVSSLGFKTNSIDDLDSSVRLHEKMLDKGIISTQMMSQYSTIESKLSSKLNPESLDLGFCEDEDLFDITPVQSSKKRKLIDGCDDGDDVKQSIVSDKKSVSQLSSSSLTRTTTSKELPKVLQKKSDSQKTHPKKKQKISSELSDISFDNLSQIKHAQDFLTQMPLTDTKSKKRTDKSDKVDKKSKNIKKVIKKDTEDVFSCEYNSTDDNPWTKSKKN